MTRSLKAAAILVVLAGAGQQAGPADPWAIEVRRQLSDAAARLGTEGFVRWGEPRLGMLLAEGTREVALDLDRDREYAVVGVCDQDCRALRLSVTDGTGYQLGRNRGGGNVPILLFRPRRDGLHRLQVRMGACRVSPCRFGVVVAERVGR